ncbi:hypothetical protein [Nonomuraea wenchangensis]|uniref:hypothetical protein n=1 Tax=Nonomuraea wenchangensis TaxID=568860 RepID=UPI00343DB1C0
MAGRGDEVPGPNPWRVRFADRRAAEGWAHLLAQAPDNLDRAWVAITSDPRRIDSRQHPLKGLLDIVKVGGVSVEQWQYEATLRCGSRVPEPGTRDRPTSGVDRRRVGQGVKRVWPQ